METGFDIAEVPGSKDRTVAEKKQQWYRTAISKMFLFPLNALKFSGFSWCFNADFDIFHSKPFSISDVQSVLEYIKIFLHGSGNSLRNQFETSKNSSLFTSNKNRLLVKSYSHPYYNDVENDFTGRLIWFGAKAINLKNR